MTDEQFKELKKLINSGYNWTLIIMTVQFGLLILNIASHNR